MEVGQCLIPASLQRADALPLHLRLILLLAIDRSPRVRFRVAGVACHAMPVVLASQRSTSSRYGARRTAVMIPGGTLAERKHRAVHLAGRALSPLKRAITPMHT
jgi:hypothetical protein